MSGTGRLNKGYGKDAKPPLSIRGRAREPEMKSEKLSENRYIAKILCR